VGATWHGSRHHDENHQLIRREDLDDFCRKHHIAKLYPFGSALRDELEAESDIDILVELDREHSSG
jgi:hypothetical protein